MGQSIPYADMDEIAQRVVAMLGERRSAGWMDTRAAAAYLGMSANALHKLTSERRIPFAQDTPGGKLWFRAADLDEWRYGRP